MLLSQIYCAAGNTCNAIPLERRKVAKKTLARTLGLVIFVIFFGGIILTPFLINRTLDVKGVEAPIPNFLIWVPGLALLFVLIIVLAQYIFQCFYYRYYFYDLKDEEVIIRKGVVSRNEITLPYSKIQNIFVDQDIFDRMFRLYDVHLETAGMTSGLSAHIDGVSEDNMNKLKNLLVEKTKKQNTGSGV